MVLVLLLGGLAAGFLPVMGQQDFREFEGEAWKFVTKVLMLDVAKYNFSVRVLTPPTELGFPTKVDLTYTFRSDGSEVTVSFIFQKGSLANCFLSFTGTPLFAEKWPENVLERAKLFFGRYVAWFDAEHVEPMFSMLDEVKALGNHTKIVENMKFMILCESSNIIHVLWNHWENGVEFRRKTVGLTFSRYDWHFADTWNLYRIGSAELRVSEEDAVRIAKEAIKTYTYTAADYEGKTVVVGNFTVLDKPLYVDLCTDNRGTDYYTLYPFWEVYLCLDTMYLGGVTGLRVLIWADTGEVTGIYPTGSLWATPNHETTDENQNGSVNVQAPPIEQIVGLAVGLSAAVAIATAITLKHKKRPLTQP